MVQTVDGIIIAETNDPTPYSCFAEEPRGIVISLEQIPGIPVIEIIQEFEIV